MTLNYEFNDDTEAFGFEINHTEKTQAIITILKRKLHIDDSNIESLKMIKNFIDDEYIFDGMTQWLIRELHEEFEDDAYREWKNTRYNGSDDYWRGAI